MDTLTQLTLGAACGEVVLGKKIGNRALLWGAFGGLLPDLDVAANLFTDEISALAFHRSFMHSIVFAILASFGLSWLINRLYDTGNYKRRWYKIAVFSFLGLLLVAIGFAINYMAFSPERGINIQLLAGAIAVFVFFCWLMWKRYYLADLKVVTATRREWFWLFWWSIFTHPVLDCFTAYGTQIFQPFTNYAVAFNNISVVDPLYTVPFLLCIIIASIIHRDRKIRRTITWIGIGISSAYMAFTLYHKWQMDKIFARSLAEQGIEARRFMAAPTILNNFLWQGVAEGDTAYYHGFYSFFDPGPRVQKFNVLPKNHNLVEQYEGDKVIRILRWFSKGYYNVIVREDGLLQFNDLRYGTTEADFEKEYYYVFKFILQEKPDGKLTAHQVREYHRITGRAVRSLYERMMGRGFLTER